MRKSKIFRNKKTSVKILSAAALVGLVGFCTQANAYELDFSQKPIDISTRDFMNPKLKEVAGNLNYQILHFVDENGNNIQNISIVSDITGDKFLSSQELEALLASDNLYKFEKDFEGTIPLKEILEASGASSLDEYIKMGEEKGVVVISENVEQKINEYYQNIDPVAGYGDVSGYKLTKVDSKGENTITKFEYNHETSEITPVHYRVDLKKTEYGEGNSVKTYDIEGNGFKTAISYKYNDLSDLSNKTYDVEYVNKAKATLYDKKTTNSYGTTYTEKYYNGGSGVVINNEGETKAITNALFKDNKVSVSESVNYNTYYIYGGAVYNKGTLTELSGDFINNSLNYIGNNASYSYGGAVYNAGKINKLSGNFINNSAKEGGAIYNVGTIGNIVANFVDNNSVNNDSYNNNVIYNSGTIDSISGVFRNNKNAIYSSGNIGSITADFIENTGEYSIYAFYHGSIANITGNFIKNNNNRVISGGNIGSVSGNFIANNGTVIDASPDSISGNFIGNTGGAVIRHSHSSGDSTCSIQADFIGNNVGSVIRSSYEYGYDGKKIIDSIVGDFISNEVTGSIIDAQDIGQIKGDFINNKGTILTKQSLYGEYYGPGNGNDSTITIQGNFLGNSSDNTLIVNNAKFNRWSEYSTKEQLSGIAIENSTFTDNTAPALITNAQGNLTIDNSSFINNNGRAVHNIGQLSINANNGTSVFSGNFDSEYDDNIAVFVDKNPYYSVTKTLLPGAGASSLDLNARNNGKIIMNDKILGVSDIDSYGYTVSYEYRDVNGASKYVRTYKFFDENNNEIKSFNYYYDSRYQSGKGSIYIINILDDENNVIESFETQDNSCLQGPQFYIDNGYITDYSYGKKNYKVVISGDETGVVQLNNDIKAIRQQNVAQTADLDEEPVSADIYLSGTQLHLGARDNVLDGNNLIWGSGILNMINNQVGTAALNNFVLAGNTNLVVDVDLANKSMDRITANKYYLNPEAKINVAGMNLLSDAKDGKAEIQFANDALKNNITTSVKEAYTPIYKYTIDYRQDDGKFLFNQAGCETGSGNNNGTATPTPPKNPSTIFNPAVLATPVAAQAGATATMNHTFNYAFQNADNFMNIPYLERIAIKDSNKYALAVTDGVNSGKFSPLYNETDSSSVWVKPYASFESIPLKNGPKVSSNSYGTLVGYDTKLIPMKKGWDRVWTGYIGYNGASQRYSGVDSTQNGGLLGGTLTLYKGNFFNATTISAGASVASNQTMYGHEDFTMLLAGIGNKTGYNFEFKEGKLILQPSLLMSYTYVNTFDYTNAAGVRINSDPLHAIQLSPGVKVIGNLKHGWQPYASVNMVWNLLDKSDVTAGSVKLPEMSIKPYVQYGVGVQKRFKDKCMAFGQAMIQNGGRNGISLTAGFRWALGKEGKPLNEKVYAPDGTVQQPVKKVLKQMTETQKYALGKKQLTTTRTAVKGVLKQL